MCNSSHLPKYTMLVPHCKTKKRDTMKNRKTGTKTGTAHLLLMSELLWEEQKKKNLF